ncbi:MAG: hypothetical protein WC234_04745 [Endomicrobiaceae bacterium]
MSYIKNKIILLTVSIALFVFSVKAYSEISVSVTVDKEDFAIGDNVNIEFNFEFPPNYELIKPEYDCIENWYVKNITLNRDKKNNNIYKISVMATTFNPMQKELPSVKFFYLDGQRKEQILNSVPVPVRVKDILKNDVDEKNIKDIKPVKILQIPPLYYYVVLLFGIYLLLVIIFYFRKKHIDTSSDSKDKIKNKMIFKLESIMLNDDNLDLNARYEALLDIAKNFIKVEYNINTNKLTSDLVVAEIAKIELSSGIIKFLSALLIKCSAIKTSGLTLTEENISVDLSNLNTIIKNSVKNKKILSHGI